MGGEAVGLGQGLGEGEDDTGILKVVRFAGSEDAGGVG